MEKLEIISGPEIKYKGYYSLTETILRFRQNDGTMSKTVSRLNRLKFSSGARSHAVTAPASVSGLCSFIPMR